MNALKILQKVYGYESFQGDQQAVIEEICQGNDALVLMPTGGGKSICYQIPALLRPGLGVVISPLIALMQDQVDALLQLGVRAAYLNSSLAYEEARRTIEQVREGQLDLLYVAPERLVTKDFITLLQGSPLALFAIDEAHCVSQWGHDFRPEYLQLNCLHELFPHVPRIALTATADVRTREEISAKLHLEKAKVFIGSFNRPNIHYHVEIKHHPQEQLLHFIQSQHPGEAGIVYCLSRKKVEETAVFLQSKNIAALPYHAGLSPETRSHHQKRFLREEGIVIVATIAFGMGINKPDVRFVAHIDCPKSLESYYQETGRAGRDGLPSEAWMCYSMVDIITLQRMMSTSEASAEVQRIEQQRLSSLLAYCETQLCRRKVILEYFGEPHLGHCATCDNCLTPVESWNATIPAQKVLSCVYRSGQNFGSHHITDILCGVANAKILKHHHETLSTFGIGKDLDRKVWLSVIRQLVLAEYLILDSQHGILKLGHNTKALLKGEIEIFLRKDVTSRPQRSERKNKSSSAHDLQLSSAQSLLFQALKSWRLMLSQSQNVAPYVIAADKVLHSLCLHTPQNSEELLYIQGMGKYKCAKYGEDIMAIFQQHPQAIAERLQPEPITRAHKLSASDSKKSELNDSMMESISLFLQGMDVDQISNGRGISAGSIHRHLCKGVEKGVLELKKLCCLKEEQLHEILAFMESIPAEGPFLRTVYDHFEARYSFEDLNVLKSYRQFLTETAIVDASN